MRCYPRLLPYGVAIGSTAIAMLLTLWLEPLMSQTIGAFFYIAILISTWYGGFRPGIVTVVLSALAIDYFFFPPRYELWFPQLENVLQLSIFLLVALTIALLTSNLVNSKQKIKQFSQQVAQENAAQLQMALSAACMGMWDWDIVTGEIKWSPEHEQLFGLTVGTFDGKYETFDARLHPDHRQALNQAIQQALQTHSPYQHEYRIIWADGSIHWVEGRGHPFYNVAGQPVRMMGTVTAIDERKRAEEDLQKSQIQLQRQLAEIETIYQSAPIGLNVLDTDLRFVRINQRLAEINGFSVEAHIGRTVRELLPELADTAEQVLRSILQTGKPLLNIEITGETPAQPGVQRTWLESFLPLKDGERIIGISTVCEEITERKQVQIALQQLNVELEQRVAERTTQLREANNRLLETVIQQQQTELVLLEQAQLLDLAHDTIMTLNLNRTIAFWNEGAEYMYGWAKNEALGHIAHILLKTQFPQPLAEIEAELLEKGYWEGELIHFSRDNQPITVASRWVLQKDNAGRPIKILEINNDITKHKQAELALRESEESRRLALDLTHVAFWDWHLPSKKIIWNDNHFTLLGLAPCAIEPSYEAWRNRVHPEDIGWVEQQFLESIKTRTDFTAEYRVIYPDGSVHWLMGRSRAIYDESGQPLRSLGVLLDITDRKRIKQALHESEERFRQLAENIQAVFWMTDIPTGQVLYVSPAYETIWQRSCESLYQNFSSWLDAIHPDDRQGVEIAFSKQIRTGQYDVKYRIIRPDASIRWIRDRAFPIKNEFGEMVRIGGIAEDITEQQKIEQIKSEFIGIVSHELRTPLTAIRAALGLLKTGIYDKNPEKFKRMIDIAAIDSERLVRLVNDILDLERLESGYAILDKRICHAAELIQMAVQGVQAIAHKQYISFDIHATDVKVWAAADTIIQTLTNLLSNALKFSPANSTITISVEQQTDRVLFQVMDRGRGIPPEKLEAIFGRFQQVDASDSRSKGGTGLGLAICRSIIEKHGGQIWAESTLGVGSTFFFTLPLPLKEIK